MLGHSASGKLGRDVPMPFVVMASGAGTNARVLIEHARVQPAHFTVKALISDRSGAPALELAAKLGIPTFVVAHREENTLLAILRKLGPRWALLAGYKRMVSQAFLDFFADEGFSRVLNVHPSLLPAYPGLAGYEKAFRDGVKISGVTVHLVDAGIDTGKVVLQEPFAREETDTLESFMAKGQSIEHRLFPLALDLAAAGRIHIKETKDSKWASLEGDS